ncbi:hypothetical protein Tco_1216636 [Tanacetum coccineum]
MGHSLIVTSNSTSPNGHDSSPEKPTRGVLESTRRDLIDGFNFRKQCSYITLHELSLSKYALFTCLPDMYTLITTGSDEPSFRMGGNVISPVPLSLACLFFSLFQEYHTSDEEEEELSEHPPYNKYGFVDHPQLQMEDQRNKFAPYPLPPQEGNMNGWLTDDANDSDLESTASNQPMSLTMEDIGGS